jgi:hypothetical protein
MKDIVKEIDLAVKDQKDLNGYLVVKLINQELKIKQLTKEINMLIIIQGLCALTMLVTSICG